MSVNTVQRAFELARTGRFRTLSELRTALRSERCDAVDQHLSGLSIQKQLKTAMRAGSE